MNKVRQLYGIPLAGVLAMVSSGAVSAEEICNLNTIPQTGAYSVQVDSGQGNYDCTVLQTTTGSMTNVTLDATITRDNANGYIKWEYDNPSLRVYSASIYTGGKGSRCNYQYPEKRVSGEFLGDGTPSTKDIAVTLCAAPDDGLDLPFQSTVIDTEADLCTAEYDYTLADGTVVRDRKFPASFALEGAAEGADPELALCANSAQATIDRGLGQKRCSGRCEPREPDPTLKCSTPNNDGSYPLECAPCEWDSTLVNPKTGDFYKACWYWQNRVCSLADAAAGLYDPFPDHYCFADDNGDGSADRLLDTFIPKTKKNSYTIEVHEIDGSTCYLYSYGRWWAYSCP